MESAQKIKTRIMTYGEFITALRLRHFKAWELTSYADRVSGGVKNSEPPASLWENIVVPLWCLDCLRESLGRPITIVSTFRSVRYNATLNGAVSNSQHLRNCAIDFKVKGMRPATAFDRLRVMRDAKIFRGGLGLYPTFVHIDNRGRCATW